MNHGVTLSFRWTSEELKDALRQHNSQSLHRYLALIGYPITALSFVLLFVLFILQRSPTLDAFLYFVVLLLLTGSMYMSSLSYQYKRLVPYRAGLFGKEISWEISDESLKWQLSGGANAVLQWNSISKVIKSPKGFLLYDTPWLFQWLPLHAFQPQKDIDNLTEIAKRKAQKFKEITLSPFPNILAGFLIAPLTAPLVAYLLFATFGFIPPLPDSILLLGGIYATGAPIAYGHAVFLGIPIFLTIRKSRYYTLSGILTAGALTGIIPASILAMISASKAYWTGPLTLTSLEKPLLIWFVWMGAGAICGVASAAVFWLIAVKLNIAEQT